MDKLTPNACCSSNYTNFIGGGISPDRFFESVVFMDGVACGNAVSSAFEINLSSEQNNNRNIGSGWQ